MHVVQAVGKVDDDLVAGDPGVQDGEQTSVINIVSFRPKWLKNFDSVFIPNLNTHL